MAAASPTIAVVAKLKADSAVNTAVGGRIYPQLITAEAAYPFIVVGILGAETSATLNNGTAQLRKYTVRIDCYAVTEIEAQANAKLVRDALTPAGAPWSDSAAGVQGCFHLDTNNDYDADDFRFQSETFELWHAAT